jgi:CBS domain-containing protein
MVFDAVRIMGEKDIGALVVVEKGEVLGVISERDYSRKIVLQGRTSRDTRVREVLSTPVIVVKPETPIEECMALMTEGRIRHLPVVTEGKLAGIISMGDLVRWIMRSQSEAIQHLQGYISGQYPG